MTKLAIHGGAPVRKKPFPAQESIGIEEKKAVNAVLDTGRLSHFRGSWIPEFLGGPKNNELCSAWEKKMRVENSLAVNSCTSALQIACGAIDLKPGDEVIVTPWSMSCSATAPLMYGAIPVFADIEKEYFCLDPKSVYEKITDKTRAIIVVDLFGQPYDPVINAIAKEYELYVIEDAAQAIGSRMHTKYAGTLGDIGCFSLTQGKHLTCGEGGMITTDNWDLFMNSALLRNHAEAVISSMGKDMESDIEIKSLAKKIKNKFSVSPSLVSRPLYTEMVGSNLRMPEIEAAITIEQLKKLDRFVATRQDNAHMINRHLAKIPCIRPAEVRQGATHSYYVQAFLFDETIAGVHRDIFIGAVRAELQGGEDGRPDKGDEAAISCGYIKPLHLMPLFKNTTHWALRGREYGHKDCPVAEQLWKNELFCWTLQQLPLGVKEIDDIISAFEKVWINKDQLREV